MGIQYTHSILGSYFYFSSTFTHNSKYLVSMLITQTFSLEPKQDRNDRYLTSKTIYIAIALKPVGNDIANKLSLSVQFNIIG